MIRYEKCTRNDQVYPPLYTARLKLLRVLCGPFYAPTHPSSWLRLCGDTGDP